MRIGELCNREVVICKKHESILDVVRKIREYHVGDLVVVDDHDGERVPIGILTDRDIVIKIVAADIDFSKISVGDVMSYELITVSEEDEIAETLKLMRRNGVRRLPVVNGKGRLQGIITVDDIIYSIAEQVSDISKLVSNQKIFEEKRCD